MREKLWKCSQRKLEQDNPLGSVIFVPECAMILSVIPTIQPLPPVRMAPQSIEEMRDWASTFFAAVRQRSVIQETTMARAGTPLSYSCIKEIFSRANRSASNALTSRSNKKTAGNKTKMKMEYDSPSDDGDIPSFEREANLHHGRGSRLRRSIRFNSRIVFS